MTYQFFRHGRFQGAALAAIAIATVSGAAQARAADKARDNDENVIIVTAQFTKQDVQEAPLAITAVNAALMEARSQTSVEVLAQRAPSVQFSAGGQGGGSQTAAVSIRGIGQTDFLFPNEPGVGVYIDDVYYGVSYGSAFDLVDLDRVEILRGPQGTLAGKNSIGGAIKLFSRRPDATSDAYIEGGYGSFNRVGVKAASNFTLVDDKLYARLTGFARHVDGYLSRLDYGCVFGVKAPGGTFAQPADKCVIGTEGGQDVYSVRGALRFMPVDGVEDNLIVDFTEDRSEASPAKSILSPVTAGRNYVTGPRSFTNYSNYTGLSDTPDQFTLPAISHMRNWGISNNLEIGVADALTLTSITAYRFSKGTSAWDGDNTTEPRINNSQTFRHRQFTQELRLSGKVGDMLDFAVGGYYYDAKSRDGGRVDINLPESFVLLDFASDNRFDQTSKSGFAHMAVHPTTGVNLTGGIRYTSEDKTFAFGRSPAFPGSTFAGTVTPLDGVTRTTSADHWDYRVALDYEFMPDVRVYGQIATGFKGGGINPRPYYDTQAVPFGIEESTSYEVGLKSRLFDRMLTLNADYYHNDYKGYQGQVTLCLDITPTYLPVFLQNLCSATRNVGDARIDGFEVEFDARPVPGLSLDGSLSYTNFRFTTGLAGSNIIPGVTKAPFVPKWKYALGAQYKVDLGTSGSLTPRLDWIWQSEMESTIPNNIPLTELGRIEARGLLNARLTYRTQDDAWEAALAVTNLNNEFYYNNKYDRRNQSGNVYGIPGRPREWQVSIKRRF